MPKRFSCAPHQTAFTLFTSRTPWQSLSSAAMPYPSVDALQRALTDTVFVYATDRKKAAGRALGTLVEIITYYLLKGWGFRDSVAIERPLSEYANSTNTHNVEYSLHPIWQRTELTMTGFSLPLTAAKIRKALPAPGGSLADTEPRNNALLSADGLLRNACTIAESTTGPHRRQHRPPLAG